MRSNLEMCLIDYNNLSTDDKKKFNIIISKKKDENKVTNISKAPKLLEMLILILDGKIRPREYESEYKMVKQLIEEYLLKLKK